MWKLPGRNVRNFSSCLYGYLAAAARDKYSAACVGVFDLSMDFCYSIWGVASAVNSPITGKTLRAV